MKQSYNSYRLAVWVICLCLPFSVLAQDKVDAFQRKEGNNGGIELNWELNCSEAYLTKFKNEPVSGIKPLSYYYRVATRFFLNRAGAKYRLYVKTGLGPEFKSFSLNKTISVADAKLVFTDFSPTNHFKYSVFQQCFINVPVLLAIEKQYGKKVGLLHWKEELWQVFRCITGGEHLR